MDLAQREVLIEEFPGGIIVLDRETCAGDAIVFGRLFHKRQFCLEAGVTEITDSDFNRIGRERVGGHDAQADRSGQRPDHGSSLISSST